MEQLAKVINDTPNEKWADGLASSRPSFKLKNANGKAMVLAIDRLPYFKKRAEGAR